MKNKLMVLLASVLTFGAFADTNAYYPGSTSCSEDKKFLRTEIAVDRYGNARIDSETIRGTDKKSFKRKGPKFSQGEEFIDLSLTAKLNEVKKTYYHDVNSIRKKDGVVCIKREGSSQPDDDDIFGDAPKVSQPNDDDVFGEGSQPNDDDIFGEGKKGSGKCLLYAPICKRFTTRDLRFRTTTDLIDVDEMDVKVLVDGVDLLKGEVETFDVSFTYGERNPRITLNTYYGSYSLVSPIRYERGQYVIEIEGKRKQVSTPNNLEVTLINQANELHLKVVDPSFDDRVDVGDRYITIQVKEAKIGGKKFFDSSKEFQLSANSRLTNINTGIKIPARFEKRNWFGVKVIKNKKSYKVDYSSHFRNSRFYNEQSSKRKTTKSVKNDFE